MSTAQTIIGLAKELEAIEARKAAILAEIAAAAEKEVPDPGPVPRRSGGADKCRAILAANPSGISFIAIREAMDLPERAARVLLSGLRQRGDAVIISRGVYGPGPP